MAATGLGPDFPFFDSAFSMISRGSCGGCRFAHANSLLGRIGHDLSQRRIDIVAQLAHLVRSDILRYLVILFLRELVKCQLLVFLPQLVLELLDKVIFLTESMLHLDILCLYVIIQQLLFAQLLHCGFIIGLHHLVLLREFMIHYFCDHALLWVLRIMVLVLRYNPHCAPTTLFGHLSFAWGV